MLRKDTVFKLGIRSYTFLVSDPILGKYWVPWCDDGCASCDFYMYILMWFLKASATRTIDS